jgi:1,5-anhydro-D-fructose reductase (1,5-anhydro-D-mannitol-forming)
VTLGWGIVGLGRIADRTMAPAIAEAPGSELRAVASRDEDRAQAFASKHGAPGAYGNYEAMLADPSVDLVLITTPNALHEEQVVAAARHGKHVLCDKPLATTVEGALSAITECRRQGVKLGISFQTRRFRAFEVAREAIASGEIGDVTLVQLEMSAGNAPLQDWRADPALAGLGTMFNVGIHGYDALRFLLCSEVSEVATMTNVGRSGDLETLALALIRFDNGTLAYVNANQVTPYHQPDLAIYGTSGSVIGKNVTRPWLEGELRVRSGSDETTTRHANHDAYARIVASFEEAVRDDLVPNASDIDGLRSVELTEALSRSARTGEVTRPQRNQV